MFLYPKKHRDLLLFSASTFLYIFFAFFLERTAFNKLFFLWFSLFGCFYFLMKSKTISIRNLIGLAVFFRIIFLFATPNLSQDFYRFIWDGRMIFEGFNPYMSLPETYIKQGIQPIKEAFQLYNGMGELNGSHYTNYPPINQLCFLIAALFASKSIYSAIIVLKIIIISADIGILYIGTKLLKRMHLPIKNIFWYVLNPFIIIELTGNLHFEGIMIFFLVWSLYLLHIGKWQLSAVILALSVSIKLIPLIFLPLFFQYFTQKKTLGHGLWDFTKFCLVVLGSVLLLFAPFLSPEFILNFANTINLWFQNFEFLL